MSCLKGKKCPNCPSVDLFWSGESSRTDDSSTDSDIEVLLAPPKKCKTFQTQSQSVYTQTSFSSTSVQDDISVATKNSHQTKHSNLEGQVCLSGDEDIEKKQVSEIFEASTEEVEDEEASTQEVENEDPKKNEVSFNVDTITLRKRKDCAKTSDFKRSKNLKSCHPRKRKIVFGKKVSRPIKIQISEEALKHDLTVDIDIDRTAKSSSRTNLQLCKFCRFTKESMSLHKDKVTGSKPVEDIPGVGPTNAARLREEGIATAKCLYGQYLVKGKEFLAYLVSLGLKQASAVKIEASMEAWDKHNN